MNNKIIKALNKITEEIINLKPNKFKKLIKKHSSGKYAKILKDLRVINKVYTCYNCEFNINNTCKIDAGKIHRYITKIKNTICDNFKNIEEKNK